MPRAAKSASKTAKKKPSTRKPKAVPPPESATAERAGPGYTIRVSVSGLLVNGNEMPGQLAADAIATLLEQSLSKAVKA